MAYDIFDSIREMQRDMDRAFSRFFTAPERSLLTSGSGELAEYQRPVADVIERDDEVVVSIDMPGMDKEDIHIDADGNNLSISAQRKHEFESEENGAYRRERSYAAYKRTFKLPAGAKADEAEANYENGVLTISVPKDETQEKRKRIDVK